MFGQTWRKFVESWYFSWWLLCVLMNICTCKSCCYLIQACVSVCFQTDRPTVIEYDDHEYIFEGFSMFAHAPLTNVSMFSLAGFPCPCTPTFPSSLHSSKNQNKFPSSWLLSNVYFVSSLCLSCRKSMAACVRWECDICANGSQVCFPLNGVSKRVGITFWECERLKKKD